MLKSEAAHGFSDRGDIDEDMNEDYEGIEGSM